MLNTEMIQSQIPRISADMINTFNKVLTEHSFTTVVKNVALVDFTKPSTEPRLFIIEENTSKVLQTALVTHGSGTGELYASRFSDTPESHQSSLGLMKTSSIYFGKHGKSLRLRGLEPGVNGNVLSRSIVIHAAPYADASILKTQNRLGRSYGCFAVSPKIIDKVIELLSTPETTNLLFAFYNK